MEEQKHPIFISYRHDDSETAVGRIVEHLIERFGDSAVFKDVESIRLGEHFPTTIHDALSDSEVVIVAIGDKWLQQDSVTGERRLDSPTDFVRIEIETAYGQGKKVFPLLIGNAEMPSRAQLPKSIGQLADTQSLRVRPDPDFRPDIERLINALEENTKALKGKNNSDMAEVSRTSDMKKSTQIICAFAFGIVFITVMLSIAIIIPYPSDFQLLTFRVTLALAAGGIAAMLPGFLTVNIPIGVRAGGALAAFAAIYFVNPASMSIQGFPTDASGVFIKELEEDHGLVEYVWKQADVRFRFPSDGWKISTKAAEAGLGDLTLQHKSGKDAQIQIHVSALDGKYRDQWEEFQRNTVGMWKGTIEQFGPFSSQEIFIDGRSAFKIHGSIRGEIQGIKKVDLVYAPLGDNRLLEMHLTRNVGHPHDAGLLRAYDLIVSTIKFDR